MKVQGVQRDVILGHVALLVAEFIEKVFFFGIYCFPKENLGFEDPEGPEGPPGDHVARLVAQFSRKGVFFGIRCFP